MEALLAQFHRYFSFFAWFAKDAFYRHRGRLILLVIANVTGVALQALAVLSAYQYAKAVENGELIAFAGLSVAPRASFGLLLSTAVTVFVLAVTSAVLVMRSRVDGARLALEYSEFCSRRIYSLVSRLPISGLSEAARECTTQRFAELARRDANYCGVVLRTMIYALLHVGTVVVAGVALLMLDPYLTLTVAALLIVSAAFLRRTSIRAASHRSRLHRDVGEMTKERRALADRIARSPVPLSPSDDPLEEAFAEGATARFRRATLGQREGLEGGKLVAQVSMGAALFLVLLVQGSATLQEEGNWSALLGYVAALSFFGSSIVRVGRTVVSINRFYPFLARYARFVQSAEHEIASYVHPEAMPYEVHAPFLGGARESPLVLQPGSKTAWVLAGSITRHAMSVVMRALKPSNLGIPASPVGWFVGSDISLSVGSLRQCIGLPEGSTLGDFQGALQALLHQRGDSRILPDNLDRPLTERERQDLQPIVPVLMVASGLLNECSVLAIEEEALSVLGAPVSTSLVERAASTCIVLVAYHVNSADQVGAHAESAVIITGNEEVFGWTTPEILLAGNKAVVDALTRVASEWETSRATLVGEDDIDEPE